MPSERGLELTTNVPRIRDGSMALPYAAVAELESWITDDGIVYVVSYSKGETSAYRQFWTPRGALAFIARIEANQRRGAQQFMRRSPTDA